jgi:ATP-dependent Clp protease ATP-binding subunit ClpX
MLKCSFCQKSENEVEKLVAGPNVYICDECVAVAARMMLEKPGLIRRFWDRLRQLKIFRLEKLPIA